MRSINYLNPFRLRWSLKKVKAILLLMFVSLAAIELVSAQAFVHPGGLHTQADLDRLKNQVAAGAQPWLAGWNKLLEDPMAQSTYNAAPLANLGSSRQRASRDAHAAYLNAIRGYIANSTEHIDCAIRICNAWSATVNQVPTGTDIPGLSGIPIFEFALVGEILRIYSPSRWAAADFDRFKSMMLNYLYPVCNNFLTNHNGACISNYWANWDACNIGAIMAIGVLCDDRAKFDEGVAYYQSGAGMGSIMNAVYTIHPGNLGQWQESGRDQEHAQLGVGLLGAACEVAWNQGLDLYGYSNNRLLAGAEYVAQYNLWKSVPYTAYNNCQNANQRWASINGRGRLDDRPLWEMIYNHYVVRKGLSAPNTQAMAQLMRPEHGSADHFGYGTLTFTRTASVYPPSPIPPVPTGLIATPGVGRVFLKWNRSGDTANGYDVLRATASGGPYTSIATWTDNTRCEHTDASVTNGTTYYYVVAARNQAGTSANSAQASATPITTGSLPAGWANASIGTVNGAAAGFANVSGGTFVVSGSGTGIGGTSDGLMYTYTNASGDAIITARLSSINWNGGGGAQKVGVMIRESLNADAKTVIMKLGDVGTRRAEFGSRTTDAGNMTWIRGNDYTWVPAWFRLQRSGNTFTAYESSDGVTWFTVGSSTIAMAGTYLVGLAVSSNNANVNTTHFDNVTITNATTGPANGIYKVTARHSGKVMEVANNGTANGSNVRQWPSNSCACQQWIVTNIGNNQYTLVGVGSGKNLDVSGVSTADGANIHIWQYTGANNQKFTITPTSGGYYRITPVHSGKAVDVAGNSIADGANIQQWAYHGGNNQQWSFTNITAAAREAVILPEETEEQKAVQVHPNPSTGEITIVLPLSYKEGEKTADLQDSSGKSIVTEKFDGVTHTLKIATLPTGLYILKVKSQKALIIRKVIKD